MGNSKLTVGIGLAVASVLAPTPASAATSGMVTYTPSNTAQQYSATSPTFGTATATIQQTSGQSSTPTWTYCANHAEGGASCAAGSHLAAGSVSSWVNVGRTTMVTLPNGAGCYEHTDPSGATWCYAGESVQDSVGASGGPFGTTPDTSIGELTNQGEAWWGSGGGPNDSASCNGMFGNAPTNQASLSSCINQFGTVTWDTSGSMVASIRAVADELAWRIGAWNGGTQPGGVSCSSRTATGSTSSDSTAPSGLWMQWSSNPSRGFWNCTQEDGVAGPPQASWNGSSWYSRSYADWNGFGWYLLYYDYSSFIETSGTAANGVATSISCGGGSSATTTSSHVPSKVAVAIDESSGLATFTDENGTVLSQISCTNSPTPRTTSPGGPPPTTAPPPPPGQSQFLISNYALTVPVGETGAVNILTQNRFTGTPQLSLVANSTQPGVLSTDPSSVDFGYFTWSPTYLDNETATYQMCDVNACGQGSIYLSSVGTAPPPNTCPYYCGQPPPSTSTTATAPPPSPNVTLSVTPTNYPTVGQLVTLHGVAANPRSATYDMKVVDITSGERLIDECGQTLQCPGYDSANTPTTRQYVAELTYSDGSPTDYSNVVGVTWGQNVVSLTACTTKDACASTAANPAAGQPAYLTATAHNADTPGNSQPDHALVIVDADTKKAVGGCPNGETVCQVVVTEPGGTRKTYFAVYAKQGQPSQGVYSNNATVTWGSGRNVSPT